MANYPQELAQDAVCHSHTGHMSGLWFLPTRPLRLTTKEWKNIYIYIYVHVGHAFHVWRRTEDTQRSTELHNSWNISHSATLLAVTYFTTFTCDGLLFTLKCYPSSKDTINTTPSIIYTCRIMQWLSNLHNLISFVRHNLCHTLVLYIFICKI